MLTDVGTKFKGTRSQQTSKARLNPNSTGYTQKMNVYQMVLSPMQATKF